MLLPIGTLLPSSFCGIGVWCLGIVEASWEAWEGGASSQWSRADDSLETYGAKVTQIKAEVGGVPTYVLHVYADGTNANIARDEQIVEALKSKKFKVITITHGTFPSPPL